MSQMYQKTKLKDVEVLTLYQGKMTNGRRSSPVPQLQVNIFITTPIPPLNQQKPQNNSLLPRAYI